MVKRLSPLSVAACRSRLVLVIGRLKRDVARNDRDQDAAPADASRIAISSKRGSAQLRANQTVAD
jgi:hypothetical protein